MTVEYLDEFSPWLRDRSRQRLDKFEQESQAIFPPPEPEFDEALLAWCEYYNRCEAFDRSVCGGQFTNRRGERIATPATSYERKLVNANATTCYNELLTEISLRVPWTMFQDARRVACRMTEEQRQITINMRKGKQHAGTTRPAEPADPAGAVGLGEV